MKKVLVGLSGGIDSSVSAYLLKMKGYKVVGITLSILDTLSETIFENTKKIAEKLDIPLYYVDVEKKFYDKVIRIFINEYIIGRTPNPCVICNRDVKIKTLYDLLKKYNADLIATGHYARIKAFHGKKLIAKGLAKEKEQSYFLALLEDKLLEKMIFPLGKLTKDEVRSIYQDVFGNLHHKKESQDLCFVQDEHYVEFIEDHSNMKQISGNIILNEKVVGKHKGIINYTVGQRKHLGIAYKYPLYVKKIDQKRNEVILSSKESALSGKIFLSKPIFHIPANELLNMKLTVKIRYRSENIPCILKEKKDKFSLDISKNPKIISPGQLAVIYYKDLVVGAGWIGIEVDTGIREQGNTRNNIKFRNQKKQ